MRRKVTLEEMKATYRGTIRETAGYFRWKTDVVYGVDFLFEKEQPLDEQELPMPFDWSRDDGSVKDMLIRTLPSLRRELEDLGIVVVFGLHEGADSVDMHDNAKFIIANGTDRDRDMLAIFSCSVFLAETIIGVSASKRAFLGLATCSFHCGKQVDEVAPKGAMVSMVFDGPVWAERMRKDARRRAEKAERELERCKLMMNSDNVAVGDLALS